MQLAVFVGVASATDAREVGPIGWFATGGFPLRLGVELAAC